MRLSGLMTRPNDLDSNTYARHCTGTLCFAPPRRHTQEGSGEHLHSNSLLASNACTDACALQFAVACKRSHTYTWMGMGQKVEEVLWRLDGNTEAKFVEHVRYKYHHFSLQWHQSVSWCQNSECSRRVDE